MFGAIEVLVPLRIDALGGGHGVIAAGFIAGAALEAVLAPLAGRFSDRVGRRDALRHRARDLRRWRCSVIGARADARRRPRGADRHLARRRPLLRPGADPDLRHRRVQQPAPGLRRRALEHGLGLGPGRRRHRRRRRRQPHRQRGAQHRDRRPAGGHRRLRVPLADVAGAARAGEGRRRLTGVARPRRGAATGAGSTGPATSPAGRRRSCARRAASELAEAIAAAAGGRAQGQRRRLRALLHRGGDDATGR